MRRRGISRRAAARPAVEVVVLINGPMDAGLSGGDMHALRLCEKLAGEGGERLTLVAPASFIDRLPEPVRPHLVPVRTPFDGRITNMPVYTLAVVLRMLAALRRAPVPRVAIASTHFFFDVVPAAVMRLRYGTRVAAYIYHLVGESERPRGLRSWVSAALERLSLAVLRRAGDVVFVDNDHTRAQLLARGFSPGQLVMTENAYDPVEPLPPRDLPSRPAVVFIGRLVDVKGVWEVLELARVLRDTVPEARVALLGDGPLRGELERALAGDDARNIELVGFVSEAEKWRRLRSASLFVSPSREEGWGIAVGEALIAGVPALVYDLPAYRHFGDLIQRVPVGNSEGFIQTATELLCDANRLEQARRHLEQHRALLPTWDDVLARELARLVLGGDPGTAAG